MRTNLLIDPAELIDHAILKNLEPRNVEEELEFAEKSRVRAVSTYYSVMREYKGSYKVRYAVVIDFPHGTSHIEAKIKAMEQAIAHGADEIEFVVNLFKLAKGDIEYVVNEARALASIGNTTNTVTKMLIDTSFVPSETIRKFITEMARQPLEERPTFIKFNTGFYRPPTIEEITTLTNMAHQHGFKVKVAGGIRSYAQVLILRKVIGVDVIGTSATRQILDEFRIIRSILTGHKQI